jgi:hypothetical protein
MAKIHQTPEEIARWRALKKRLNLKPQPRGYAPGSGGARNTTIERTTRKDAEREAEARRVHAALIALDNLLGSN